MVSTKMGSLHQTPPKKKKGGGFGRGYVMISLVKITEQKQKRWKHVKTDNTKFKSCWMFSPFRLNANFLATTENCSFWGNHVAKQNKASHYLQLERSSSWKMFLSPSVHTSSGHKWNCWSITGWWFQPISKTLVKLRIFPQIGMNIKDISNHHLGQVSFRGCIMLLDYVLLLVSILLFKYLPRWRFKEHINWE